MTKEVGKEEKRQFSNQRANHNRQKPNGGFRKIYPNLLEFSSYIECACMPTTRRQRPRSLQELDGDPE